VKKTLTVGSLIPKVQRTQPNHAKQQHTPYGKLPEKTFKDKKTEKVLVQQKGTQFAISPLHNHTLLDAALAQNQALSFKCKKGSCGACTVKVLNGSTLLCAPTAQEIKKLEQNMSQGYRLACQAVFK